MRSWINAAIAPIAARTADRTATDDRRRLLAVATLLAVAACSSDAADSAGRDGGTGAVAGSSGSAGAAGASGSGAQSGSGAAAGADGSAGSAGDGGTSGSSGGTGGAGGASGTTGAGGAGGSIGSGGAAGTGGAGGAGTDPYPCDAPTSLYDAVVTGSGTTWSAERAGSGVYSGNSMADAIQAAIDSLSSGRTTKQSVLVQGSGAIPNNRRISVASYTVLNVCGTIDVTNAGGAGDMAPIYARGRSEIQIPHATITGVPIYGMFFRDVDNLHLGEIELRLSGTGLGIRIDNHGRQNRADKVRNIRLDRIHVEGTGDHGVETYGVDGLVIGSVVARDTGNAGLLLNDTINAEVTTVDGDNAASVGTGYAAFRIANAAGRVGSAWPAGNIHVGQVIARRGGRGIFCVSDSGGLTIDRIDIEDTGNDSILLENCHDVRIAATDGSVSGGGQVRISQRTNEHTPSSDITLQNLTVTGTSIRESPCGNDILICNIGGSPPIDACSGTFQAVCP